MTCQRGVTACSRAQPAFSDHQYFGISNSFGYKRMPLGGFQSENVAGQVETADLSAAIAENFVCADCSADDFIKSIRRLILVDDLHSARIVSAAADELHPAI